MPAVITLLDVATERAGATDRYGVQGALLVGRQCGAESAEEFGCVGSKDIAHFERMSCHAEWPPFLSCVSLASTSKGLGVACSACRDTCV